MAGPLFTYGPANVETLLATTRSAFQKSKAFFNDAIFNKIPLLNFLNTKARVTRQGGASILTGLMFGKNTTFKAYTGDETLDTTGQEGLTLGQWQWRNYGGTIKYTGEEIRQNGAEKLTDLAKAKTMQAVMSARDTLAGDLFASSQVTKQVSTLPVLVDATSTVADINSTTNSWWQGTVTTGGSFPSQGLEDMRATRDTITQAGQSGGSGPDFIVTTAAIKRLYETSQTSSYRYEKTQIADAGHENLMFSGAVLEFDPNCASGEMYMLPSDALEFAVHSQADWDIGEFQKPPTQDVWIAQVLWMGNLTTNNRRRLGKIVSITS